MRNYALAALLSFTGGFVDTAGFLGLQGLFTAHVTGNFVTLGATRARHPWRSRQAAGAAGVRARRRSRQHRRRPARAAAMAGGAAAVVREGGCCSSRSSALAVALGPFPDSDAPAARIAGFAGVAAMAVQNAVQRIHLDNLAPGTLMTGNTTPAVLDAVALVRGAKSDQAAAVRGRFNRMFAAVVWFAAGCALAATLYAWVGFVSSGSARCRAGHRRARLRRRALARERDVELHRKTALRASRVVIGDNSRFRRAIYFPSLVYASVMRGIRSQQKARGMAFAC